MKIKTTPAEKLFTAVNTVFMLLLMVVTLYPLVYVAFASVSSPEEMVRHTGILLRPLGFTTGAYKMVFDNPMILQSYGNTLFYVLAGTALNIVMTTLAAFLLSRRSFMIKNALMMFVVFTMFFNGGLIPNYLIVRSLGLYNTRLALILPTAISTYNLIIMRTSLLALPASLEESAKIDGASELTVLIKIILPLSMPIVAVMILFYGVGHWNSWFNAMIYLRNRELYPLQLILREILISSSTDSMLTNLSTSVDKEPVSEIVKYATIMVATVPILLVYPFLQKYFVKGVMIGAVKG
ncbi:MAG: carbohydrate ABC transporter permease [Provencibacterium sp.]|jgi:putative aldouronate transport system permease protein|nr:carbohydrate ABC transporter permease [Provencibacterium sp.]